ncbi:MAG: hypothetical protein ACJ760_05380 [Thermoleophilaceae bacterium]
MADDIELHYIDQQSPEAAIQQWRTSPPQPVRDGHFKVVDESYNSLTYEARFYDTPQKILIFATLGVAWLMRKIVSMQSIWNFTVRFDKHGDGVQQAKVTIFGHAPEETRTALGELAAEHGGAVDLRVGA